jgi:hypothetical protein
MSDLPLTQHSHASPPPRYADGGGTPKPEILKGINVTEGKNYFPSTDIFPVFKENGKTSQVKNLQIEHLGSEIFFLFFEIGSHYVG